MPKTSYLSQLKFDPNLSNKWWAKYLVNIRLVVLLILAIVAIGIYSYFTVPRRVNPEIKIPIVIISTILPGASPADIESLITIPIEDKLDNVEGIDTMTSVSRDNISLISLQFLSSIDGDKALQEVQREIGSGNSLPENVEEPDVNLLDFENQPIWTFAITTKGDTASLMRFSKQLRDELEDLDKIDRVQLSGFDTQEIQVIVDPKKIAVFGISPIQISQIIQKATSSYPAGSIRTENLTFSLSIDKEAENIEDIRKLKLNANGNQFQLGDIASVIQRSKINQQKTYFVSSSANDGLGGNDIKKAVQFYIFKAKDANIDAAEIDASKLLEERISQFKGEFEVTTVTNIADEIVQQFDELFMEFGATILLVFILLVIFLGLRQSVIALITIPLTLLSTLVVIKILGLSLNFLTAFAFLIALGLLIDDTIVTVAAMTRYYLTGKFTPAQTAILVWKDFIVPLWSMTITVIWAFVPLLLAGGIIGEFIKSIPIIVTATMISSTTIAVFITLPIMVVLLKPQLARRVKILVYILSILLISGLAILLIPKSAVYPLALGAVILFAVILITVRKNLKESFNQIKENPRFKKYSNGLRDGFFNIEKLSEAYKKVIDKILSSGRLRRNTIIAVVIFAIVGYSLVPLGFVKSEFFPKSDEDILYVQVDLPAGTNLEAANKEMIEFVKNVKLRREINYFVADTGASLSENFDRTDTPSSFLLTLHLLPDEERAATASKIAEELRSEYGDYTKGTVRVLELSGGPPAGADVQIGILGDDLAVLDSYSEKIKDWLKTQKGVANVQSSNKASTGKIVFVPDKEKLLDAGLTADSLGLWMRTYASGFPLDTLKVENDDMDITFLMGDSQQSATDLSKIMVPTAANGGGRSANVSVPLLSLGTVKLENNPASITRINGSRQVNVTASVIEGASATEKSADLLKYAQSLDMPQGYTLETGGVNEENEKSVQSILQAMLLSFILILVTMVIEFGSYRQTAIALMIIPLGITGVFYIFALTGTPLSFPALIGILALFGIVVRHVIIVIEKINDNRKHGMELKTALVDAAGSRLEPVLLTSLAAIAGLIPITFSDPLWRGLGGAIIAGLIFSGVIKLFFVPVVYYEWFKEKSGDKKSG